MWTGFSKTPQISNFIKIIPVGTKLFNADEQTDIHDEADSRFSQFWERIENLRPSGMEGDDIGGQVSQLAVVLENRKRNCRDLVLAPFVVLRCPVHFTCA